MPLTVYKYALPPTPDPAGFTLSLPDGARLLTVQAQHDEPKLFALVDPEAPLVRRMFWLAYTGIPIHVPNDHTPAYVGTFQLFGGDLIGHVFELMEIPI